MDVLKQLGAFLGWLSGVLAGVAAILYSFGFIALAVHHGILGVGWAGIGQDPPGYLTLGGRIAGSWLLVGTLALVLTAAALALLRGALHRLAPAEGRPAGALGRAAAALGRRPLWLVALALLAIAQLVQEAFGTALGTRDLLFAPEAQLCGLTGAAAELVRGHAEALQGRAMRVYFWASVMLCLLALTGRRLTAAPVRLVPAVICLAAGLVTLGLVPIAHGYFVMPKALPEARLGGALPEGVPSEGLRLVAATQSELWLWTPSDGSLHWLPRGALASLRLTPPVPPRSLSCAAPGPDAQGD